jgi:hypothetical protein
MQDVEARQFRQKSCLLLFLHFLFHRFHLRCSVANHIVNRREIAGSVGRNAGNIFALERSAARCVRAAARIERMRA